MGFNAAILRRRRRAGGGSGLSIYVDSVNGNDANDGSTPALALASISALPTITQGMGIGLARGSEWREQLTITADNVIVAAYGTGAKPHLRADDIVANANFSKTGGYTNVYEVSLSVAVDAIASEWPAIWVDGTRLTWAADLATCDATPGTYYHGSVEGVSSITLYIHSTGSTNPISDGKVYEAAVRTAGVMAYASDGCRITGIKGSRNYSSYGSIVVGRNGIATDVEAVQGTLHNIYMRSGATLVRPVVTDGLYVTASFSLIVAYDTNPTDGVTVIDPVMSNSAHEVNSLGFYAHTGAGTFPFINITGGSSDNCGVAVSAAQCDLLSVTGMEITNFTTGFTPACDAVFTDIVASSPKTGANLVISGAANISVTMDGLTSTFNTTGTFYSVHSGTTFTLINSTMASHYTVIRGTQANQTWVVTDNVFSGTMFTPYNLQNGTGLSLTSDRNTFGGTTGTFTVGGTAYANFATYRAETEQDLNSDNDNGVGLSITAPTEILFANGDQPYALTGAEAISFDDAGSGDSSYVIEIAVGASGTLTLASTTGLTGSGDGTGTLDYTGTRANILTALDGIEVDGLSGEVRYISIDVRGASTGRTASKTISVTSEAASSPSAAFGLLISLTKAA